MATTLAPVDSREVVRCDHCLLVQFRTSNNNCRRCHASLDEEPEPEPIMVAPPMMMPVPGTNGRGHLNLATSIRSLRLRNGLSQRQLAGRMSVPRTYVSKIENEKATPTLSSLERLARALEVTVPDLLSGGERNRQEEAREPDGPAAKGGGAGEQAGVEDEQSGCPQAEDEQRKQAHAPGESGGEVTHRARREEAVHQDRAALDPRHQPGGDKDAEKCRALVDHHQARRDQPIRIRRRRTQHLNQWVDGVDEGAADRQEKQNRSEESRVGKKCR